MILFNTIHSNVIRDEALNVISPEQEKRASYP